MLDAKQLRQVAARSGARDMSQIEIDVILTLLLQLFHERGLTEHLAFKGGTMLRKMVFGPRGRLSTDLDFTLRGDLERDDVMLMMLDALDTPYQGLDFRFDRNKDWYTTEEGFSANPVCSHAANAAGVKIKLQVSTREKPFMPVAAVPQLKQDYFNFLPFPPADIPSLAMEEIIAEKIRAASQRTKVRDLHDLAEIAKRPLNHDLVRGLATLKLWNSGGPGLDYGRLSDRIDNGDYDVEDLRNLLRKDQAPDIDLLKRGVKDGFRFLRDLSAAEAALAADSRGALHADALNLVQDLAGG
ncbi:MAG TPA: nucleotidyl transferase AbiEii/AbiGii toxin family protein [Allosphingosinicella sp.]|jgi:predicted nucleotidyltransferase component of viral defense system|nr:nucleotidyl transferase AbiEii/AbiGii toxin family protein [Allosphingosinicella sp.]